VYCTVQEIFGGTFVDIFSGKILYMHLYIGLNSMLSFHVMDKDLIFVTYLKILCLIILDVTITNSIANDNQLNSVNFAHLQEQ